MYFAVENASGTSAGSPPDVPSGAPAELSAGLAAAPVLLQPALARRGFTELTAVQSAVLAADDGASDVRITSQTGSGKTVALGFVLLDRLDTPEREGPTTLVIAPTRELAMQVQEELRWLFADLPGVRCEVVTGGTDIDRERQRLRRRPQVLVGTPGRLLDHLRNRALSLASVRQLVLDEADQMLDMGFKDELDGILAQLPAERRTHLVSATFPHAVLDLADRFQRAPLPVQGTPAGTAHGDIEHVACRIGGREHYAALVNLLLLAGDERTLVFARTREDTGSLADRLAGDGFHALPIHGDLSQSQRTRTLQAFRQGTVRTLIATDVAARGLDIQAVTMVVHMELPIDSATYVHRSGRTGRAGQKGRSVLLLPKTREARARRIYREAGLEPRWMTAPTPERIAHKHRERATAAALLAITSPAPAAAEMHTAAQSLLQDRDPVAVVAALLARDLTATRPAFELTTQAGAAHRPTAPRPTAPSRRAEPAAAGHPTPEQIPAEPDDSAALATPASLPERRLGAARGRPGAPPSWQRPAHQQDEHDRGEPQPAAAAASAGFTRFRINWGTADGADPRRLLAHICRRGDIDSAQVGAITLRPTSSTFEVMDAVAVPFARRTQRRDRRDPHLFIERETFDARRPPARHPRSQAPRKQAPRSQPYGARSTRTRTSR